MRYFAKQLGYTEEIDFWGLVGLLHDLDFEKYPDQHCERSREILKEHGFEERFIRAVICHGYGLCGGQLPKPEHEMEKILYATDELTGLIGAAARMRPSKSVMDLTVSSLKKKFKSKGFAAGCNREVIANGAAGLGWDLEELFEQTILAMRSCEAVVNVQLAAE